MTFYDFFQIQKNKFFLYFSHKPKMTNVLIIGASRGIGLEFANQFSKKGVNLYLTCRKSNPQIISYSTNNNAKIIENIDISKDEVSEDGE